MRPNIKLIGYLVLRCPIPRVEGWGLQPPCVVVFGIVSAKCKKKREKCRRG